MVNTQDVEQWTEYSIGIVVIFLRIFTRTRMVGFKGWKGDDWLVIFALICSTTQIAMHELMEDIGTIGGINAAAAAKLTSEQVANKQRGSKYNFVSWIAYTSLIWSLKGCMLFLYARLTTGLRESKMVKATSIVVGATYFGMLLLIVFNCFPTYKNWTLFPNPGRCTYNLPHFYVLGPLNILTDMMLLFIPIPLIRRSKLPTRRKLGIAVILCGGVFIIIASFLNNLFSLLYKFDALYGILNHHFADMVTGNAIFILNWGVREAFIAIIVVNAPCIKPLFTSSAWLRTSKSRSGMSTSPAAGSTPPKVDEEDAAAAQRQQDFYNFSRRQTQISLHGKSNSGHSRYDSDDGTMTYQGSLRGGVPDDTDLRSDAVRLEEGLSRPVPSLDLQMPPPLDLQMAPPPRLGTPGTPGSPSLREMRKAGAYSPVIRV